MMFSDLGRNKRRSLGFAPASVTRVLVRSVCLGTILTGLAGTSPAQAKVVKFPETHPTVSLDIPDGWSVAYSSVGLELRSPEKNSLVVANLFKKDKAGAQAWPQQARQAFEKNGVSFGETATPKSPVSLPTVSTPTEERFTFSGAPAVDLPGVIAPAAGSTISGAPSMATMIPGAGAPGSTLRNKIPHKIVNYQDGIFEGKPTDLQLYIYSLTRDDLFLIEQQSTGTDDRAIAIVYSVKSLH